MGQKTTVAKSNRLYIDQLGIKDEVAAFLTVQRDQDR